MKYIIIILLIIYSFIVGMNISNNYINYNEILQGEIDYFEEEIIRPNNNYIPKNLVPTKNKVSSIASKIDNTIDNVINKIKDMIKKL